MRHTIAGFSQRKALEFGLKWQDLEILAWIRDFWPSPKMKKIIIKNEEYGWVNYSSLLKDVPIIEISTPHGLYKRMKKIVDKGFLKHQGVKDKSGSFSYYKLTEKIMILLDDDYTDGGVVPKGSTGGSPKGDDGSPGKEDGSPKKDDTVIPQGTNKDLTTNNPSSILPNHTSGSGSFSSEKSRWTVSDIKMELSSETLQRIKKANIDIDAALERYTSWIKEEPKRGFDVGFPRWIEKFYKIKLSEAKDVSEESSFHARKFDSKEEERSVRKKIRGLLMHFPGEIADLFMVARLEKTLDHWKILVHEKDFERVAEHQELLAQINVKIEVA